MVKHGTRRRRVIGIAMPPLNGLVNSSGTHWMLSTLSTIPGPTSKLAPEQKCTANLVQVKLTSFRSAGTRNWNVCYSFWFGIWMVTPVASECSAYGPQWYPSKVYRTRVGSQSHGTWLRRQFAYGAANEKDGSHSTGCWRKPISLQQSRLSFTQHGRE